MTGTLTAPWYMRRVPTRAIALALAGLWPYQARSFACDLIDALLPRRWHTRAVCPFCRRIPT